MAHYQLLGHLDLLLQEFVLDVLQQDLDRLVLRASSVKSHHHHHHYHYHQITIGRPEPAYAVDSKVTRAVKRCQCTMSSTHDKLVTVFVNEPYVPILTHWSDAVGATVHRIDEDCHAG